jgi:hypothetical protein
MADDKTPDPVEDRIRELVETWPPLTDEQRRQLSTILEPS